MLNQLNINIFNLINQFAGHNFFDDSLIIILAKYLPFVFILFLILGIIGGTARIYCGLHYPFDILGSILVAIISSGIIFSFKNKLQCES